MSWESWDRTSEKGPVVFLVWIFLAVFLLGMCLIPLGCTLGWFHNAAETIKHETSLSEQLRRYNWFKDASATLDSRLSTIKLYEKRFDNLKKSYDNEPRSKWSRADQEQSNVWEMELAGIKASYNNLAAEYNAAMAKENW